MKNAECRMKNVKEGLLNGQKSRSHPSFFTLHFSFIVILFSLLFTGPVFAIEVDWEKNLDAAKAKAKKYFEENEEPQLLVIFFYIKADPSTPKLTARLFSDRDLYAMNRDYIWVAIEAKANKETVKKMGIRTVPAFVIANHEGDIYKEMQGDWPDPAQIRREILKCDDLNEMYFETKQALEDDPDNLEGIWQMSQLWLNSGKPGKAKEYLEKLLKKAAGEPAWTARAYFGLGRMAWQNKKTNQANEYYKKAQLLDPDNKSGIRDKIDFKIACIPFNDSKNDDAIKALEAYIKKYPGSKDAPFAIYIMARCYYNMNNIDKACGMWEKVAKEHPESKYGKHALKLLIQEKKRK